jgi:hypothetical protein
MEPGGTTDLPSVTKQAYNPTHPNQAFGEFTKDFRRKMLRRLTALQHAVTDLRR